MYVGRRGGNYFGLQVLSDGDTTARRGWYTAARSTVSLLLLLRCTVMCCAFFSPTGRFLACVLVTTG